MIALMALISSLAFPGPPAARRAARPVAVAQANPADVTPTEAPREGDPGARAPEPSGAGAQGEPTAPSAEYTIGAGDILEIEVFGNDDLSRTATVQTNGGISLPLLGEVTVVDLTPSAAAARLTDLLGRDYLVNPQVEVRVKEYRSRYVSIVGEVQRPNRYAMKGRMRLIDALAEAGGLSPRASGEVSVTRINGRFANGEPMLRVRLGGPLTPENQQLVETELANGDIVTASPRHYVTVEGEVQRPNRYPIEGELTVTGALTLAGGLTRYGSNDVKIRRIDPQSGKTEIIEADLKAIRKGKQVDAVLEPNDTVTVSRRVIF
jgi:polysaccharide export outer membrane protein